MFQSASQGNDLIARAMQHGRLANPLLIKPYRQDAGLPQIWLVPVVGQNNRPTALLTFTYDDKAHELSADDFAAVTGNMFYMTHIFPSIRAGEAIAAVKREHHVAIATNRSAELIYFPSDVNSLQDGKQSWRLGGTSVLDPIWRVPGANGHWYYIDHSGHSHQSNELPVEASMPAAPDSTAIQ